MTLYVGKCAAIGAGVIGAATGVYFVVKEVRRRWSNQKVAKPEADDTQVVPDTKSWEIASAAPPEGKIEEKKVDVAESSIKSDHRGEADEAQVVTETKSSEIMSTAPPEETAEEKTVTESSSGDFGDFLRRYNHQQRIRFIPGSWNSYGGVALDTYMDRESKDIVLVKYCPVDKDESVNISDEPIEVKEMREKFGPNEAFHFFEWFKDYNKVYSENIYIDMVCIVFSSRLSIQDLQVEFENLRNSRSPRTKLCNDLFYRNNDRRRNPGITRV